MTSAPLGALACQRNSYEKTIKSKVVSCTPSKKPDLFEIILSDSVLFPEGGGQPRDCGTINGVEVVDVQRINGQCVHVLPLKLEVDQEVDIILNWDVRFDRMQHHSGQHLLSAICVREYNFKTVSWNLGEQICQVELNTTQISQEQIDNIERIVNQEIRACRPVIVKTMSQEDLASGDHRVTVSADDPNATGPIRMIEIEGIDACTCCGTHVINTSELQMMKLLHTEKTRGNTRLYFVVGNRVLKIAQRMLENERALTQALNTGPSEHLESVDRLQKQLAAYKKQVKNSNEDMAELLSEKLNSMYIDKPALFYHHEGGDMESLNIFSKPVMDKYPDKVVFMSAGDSVKGNGVFVMFGSEERLKTLGPEIAKLVDGKGGGKKGKFQGTGNKITKANIEQIKGMIGL